MGLPRATITKQDGNTGAVRPSNVGVLAIIAPSATGTPNLASAFFREDLALSAFGLGPLAEYTAYDLAVANNPALLVKPTTSTAASYGSFNNAGVTGTSVPSAGATAPTDDYNVVVNVVAGGTIGVTGIQ